MPKLLEAEKEEETRRAQGGVREKIRRHSAAMRAALLPQS